MRPGLLLTRWWHRVRRPLTHRRRPYIWLARHRRGRADLVVRPDSALLIEAPMRSGNTFAVAAFWLSNGRHLHVGRHLHTPAHVLEAVRLGVPAVVIVRDPRAVAVSHVLRRPALTVRDSLIDYAAFFEALEPIRSQIVNVSFESVIGSFDEIVATVNSRAGTAFLAPTCDEEFLRAVTALVEDMNRAETVSGGEVDELRVARPSQEREQLKSGFELELARPDNEAALARALAAYDQWR